MCTSFIRFFVIFFYLIRPVTAIDFFELIQFYYLIANCFLFDFIFLVTLLTILCQVVLRVIFIALTKHRLSLSSYLPLFTRYKCYLILNNNVQVWDHFF